MEITSPANPQFKLAQSLTQSKGIKENALLLLSGQDLVQEFLQDPHLEIAAEIIPLGKLPLTEARSLTFSKKLFEQIDVLGTHSNILILNTPEIKPLDTNIPPQGLSLVVPFGDPGNLGAAIRTGQAFAADQIILTLDAANPFLPKSIKSSAGASLRAQLYRGPFLRDLSSGVLNSSVGLDAHGKSLLEYRWPENIFLIVGEEGPGLGKTLPKTLLSIPTQGVESLNANVALSIACFHYRGQHAFKK